MASWYQKLEESNESGFTLVELLVVILIIGILSAIAVPVFLNQRNRAVDMSIEANARYLHGALMMYGLDEERFPHQGTAATDGLGKPGIAEKLLGLSAAGLTHPKAKETTSFLTEEEYGPWMDDDVYNYRAFSSGSESPCWTTSVKCDSYLISYKLSDGTFKTIFGTLKPEKCRQNDVAVKCLP